MAGLVNGVARATQLVGWTRRRAVPLLGAFAACVSGGTAVASTPPAAPVSITPAAVASAKQGVVEFIASWAADPQAVTLLDEPCPIIRDDQINFFLGQAGMTPNMDGYGAQITFQEELQTPVIACGVDATRIWQTQAANPDAPHSALVIAFNLDGLGATFADVVELAGLTMLDPDTSAVGGEIAASCESADPTLCIAEWHLDGLVVFFAVTGPAADVTQDVMVALLNEMLPTIVESLAAHAPGDVTTTPTSSSIATTNPAAPDPAGSSVASAEPTNASPIPLPSEGETFGPGLLVVGVDITAGRYVSMGESCSWTRLDGVTGAVSETITVGLGDGREIVDIAPTDAGFSSTGCGFWITYSPPPAPVTEFDDGAYVVGSDIQPGTYEAPGGPNCGWFRVSGFGGTVADIIEALYLLEDPDPDGAVTVTIQPTDIGFTSSDCGTWTPSTTPGAQSSTVPAATPNTTAAAAPSGPTAFATGLQIVGVDVQPGRYTARMGPGESCHWQRLSGTTGAAEDVVAEFFAFESAQVIVDILADDVAFTSDLCADWTVYVPADTATTSFIDGDYVVGSDIAPGTYTAPGGDACYYARLNGFSGAVEEFIVNDFGTFQPMVTIEPTDVGFSSSACGTWTAA